MTASSDARIPLRRALVSVYDKSGLDDLVLGLHELGVALVSTGGSAAQIESLGVPVTRVEDLTGFPECLDGRVKTLHPAVHAGILADRRLDSHVAQLEELGIEPFDLVVSNLYPFRQTVASGASPDECVEQIDIGGPSMVRAAAKNHAVRGNRDLAEQVRRRAARREGRRLHARRAPGAGSRGLRRTPRRTTWPWPSGSPRSSRPTRRCGGRTSSARPSSAPPCSGTGRTHTSRPRSTSSTAPRPAWRTRSSCTARRCRTTTTSTPRRRTGRPTTSPRPRSRSSSTRIRAGSPSARTSPRRTTRPTSATRCRRSAA